MLIAVYDFKRVKRLKGQMDQIHDLKINKINKPFYIHCLLLQEMHVLGVVL